MKTKIYFFLSFLLILTACAKEETDEEVFNRLKAAGLPIPMTVDFTAIHDLTVPQVNCTPEIKQIFLPGKVWLNGTATHLGTIYEMNSYALNAGCEIIDATHMKELFSGVITAGNKDNINFTGSGIIDLTNMLTNQTGSIVGEINLDNGNGIFIGVKGKIIMSGIIDFKTGSMNWDGDGYLIFEKL